MIILYIGLAFDIYGWDKSQPSYQNLTRPPLEKTIKKEYILYFFNNFKIDLIYLNKSTHSNIRLIVKNKNKNDHLNL